MADTWCARFATFKSSCDALMIQIQQQMGSGGFSSQEYSAACTKYQQLKSQCAEFKTSLDAASTNGSIGNFEFSRRRDSLMNVTQQLQQAHSLLTKITSNSAVGGGVSETVDTAGRTNNDLIQEQQRYISTGGGMERHLDQLSGTLKENYHVAVAIDTEASRQMGMLDTIETRIIDADDAVKKLSEKCEKVRYAAKKTSWGLAIINGIMIGAWLRMFIKAGIKV